MISSSFGMDLDNEAYSVFTALGIINTASSIVFIAHKNYSYTKRVRYAGWHYFLVWILQAFCQSDLWALFEHFFLSTFLPAKKKCWEKSAVKTSWNRPESQDSCFEHFMGLFCIFARLWSSQYFVFLSGRSLHKIFEQKIFEQKIFDIFADQLTSIKPYYILHSPPYQPPIITVDFDHIFIICSLLIHCLCYL